MSLADEYAARFNALEYVSGNALNVINFYDELDEAGTYEPDERSPEFVEHMLTFPAFTIFNDGHLTGMWTFSDGSSMRIDRTYADGQRMASVI